MKINGISVTGLFGLFNHTVPLQNPDRVTIIHGPNGFGKTAILRMIAGFVEGKTSIFERTPFDEFRVDLEDGSACVIERHVDLAPGAKPRARLDFFMVDSHGTKTPLTMSSASADVPRALLSRVDSAVPSPYRLSGTVWIAAGDETYSLSEILERFPDAAELLPKKYRPGPLFDVAKDLEVFFVETNRLEMPAPSQDRSRQFSRHLSVDLAETEQTKLRVEHHSRNVVGRIQSVTTAYARRSQERDRTFPERLVRFVRDGQVAFADREILARMSELESKRKRLISLGLLDSEGGLRDLTEEDVRRAPEALTIYVGDMDEKLKVFDDVAQRIGSLVDILNNRFKYKKLGVDREHGFRVMTDLEQVIPLGDLSSGEQHELILLYELLFRGPSGGLVLVDEPEISLHVGWQSRFLSDLIAILKLSGNYGIVATHSPVIIGSRSDLTVTLKGPELIPEEHGDARGN